MLKFPAFGNTQTVMGNFMKTVFIISFFLFFLNGHGQIFNTDPFKIDNYIYFNIPLSKTEVLTNKVKKVSLVTFGVKKNSHRRKKGLLNYYIEFDNQGNPTHYYEKIYDPLWWWPNLLQNLHLQKESSSEYNYFFHYDSLLRLNYIQEIIIDNATPESKEINDVYYLYSGNLLTAQTISEKTIYKPSFRYRGEIYQNDTIIIKYFLYYNDKNYVSTVYKCRFGWSITEINNRCDSVVYNCPFDSIFIDKKLSRNIKVDSLGQTSEDVIHSVHALTIDGYCISPDSPNDLIVTYFYDKNWKLTKIEIHKRKGDFVRRQFFNYDVRGLPLCNQYENMSVIECFEYEYY